MRRVVCVGSANVDVMIYVDRFSAGDEEHATHDVHVCSGGSAGNIASGVARLGKASVFFGNIGSDDHTKMLLEDFEKDGVDCSFAISTVKPNNTVYSVVDRTGNRQLYAYNNVELSASDFPDELLGADFVVFTSLIHDGILGIYAEIARRAKARGAKIILVPGNIFARMGMARLKPLMALCDYLILSKNEEALLEGAAGVVPKVIVTAGKDNIKYFSPKLEEFPVRPVSPVDTTGAGDCFAAAFVYSLLEGRTEGEAIRFASLAAGLSTMKKGARSMPSLEEIRRFHG